MRAAQRLVVVVGGPGSGKDVLVQGVHDLGGRYAQVVPKHTSRHRRLDDGAEVICCDDESYDLEGCDLVYELHDNRYGLKIDGIWEGLRRGLSQVVVMSEAGAINRLRREFGEMVLLLYIHSNVKPDEFEREVSGFGDRRFVEQRKRDYALAFELFMSNFGAFRHVLIYSEAREDLYDQIFRLFRAYDLGLLR